jgi:hypothetical protein
MLTLFKSIPQKEVHQASHEQEAHKLPEESLEEIMLELLNYGQPRVGVYGSDGKWHCNVEMNTNSIGSDFKVRSEWNHATPIEAAKLCRDRVIKAVSIYKEIK